MSTSENETKRGTVYTFYSFKGGTGRTMALANVAALLAKWGRSVLVVDWDLEAPGVERFFTSSKEKASELRASRPGIADLMQGQIDGTELDWRECAINLESGVSIISAGREDGEYVGRIQRLDFGSLFKQHNLGAYIERLRTEWIASFDFVLIDSRTGVTDIGGICTIHLPDILVVFFTANDSSTEGAIAIVQRAREAQERLPLDRGHLIAVPVPSKDESRTEYKQAMHWKDLFARRFSDLYRDWLPSGIKPREAVELLRIPYIPYWSFGEQLPAIVEGTSDPGSLGYAYEILARLLVTRLNWYEALEGRKFAPVPPIRPREIDKRWLEKHRESAMQGLKQTGKPGFVELYHSCLDYSIVPRQQVELLAIAEQASIHTFGWPIGVVLRNREDSRPRPTNKGIVAQIFVDHGYDYWTLTADGDFYTLMSLFEDYRTQGELYFDTQIVRTTEAVLHCINVYKAFGVEPTASVALTIRHGGLRGRQLTGASPNRLPLPFRQNLHEDEVTTTVAFRVGVNQSQITKLVKTLCEPLFIIFDFATLPDSTYEQIISSFIQGRIT